MFLALVALTVAVVAVAALVCFAFLDVAFQPPKLARTAVRNPGTLPPLRSRDVFDWFSASAEHLTNGLLVAQQDAVSTKCSGKSCKGTCAGKDKARPCVTKTTGARLCPPRLGVTPLEVLNITAHLQKTRPADQIETIRRSAEANASRLSRQGANGCATRVPCPLACPDGTCMVQSVRPVQCRVNCELFGHDAGNLDAERTRMAAQGAADGLDRAMTAAGLSDLRYELNGALTAALSIPDVAETWASGGNPFDHCARYSSTATK